MAGELNCYGWAARDASGVLSPYKFTRRATGPDDVTFRTTHCGMCHAELVWLFNQHGDAKYPMVPGGSIVLIGFPHEHKFAPANVILGMRNITGSIPGSIAETQEMLHFCAKNKVTPMIEMVDIKTCNEALQRMVNKDVRYRFVIDIERTLLNHA